MAVSTATSGVRTTGNFLSTRIAPNVVHPLFHIRPWEASASLMAMVTGRGKQHVENSMKVTWHELQSFPQFFNPATAVTDGADTSILFSDDDATFMFAGQVFQDSDSGETLRLSVVGSSGGGNTTMTFVRDLGGESRAAAMTTSTKLRALGMRMGEAADYPAALSATETEFTNYITIQPNVFSIGREAKMVKILNGRSNAFYLPEKQLAALLQHKVEIEQTFWWGEPKAGDGDPSDTSDISGDVPGQAGGIYHYILKANNSNLIHSQTNLTEFEFLDFIAAGYDRSTGPKVLFVSPKIASAFDKWQMGRQLISGREATAGMAISKWRSSLSPSGETIIVTHKLLGTNEQGTGSKDYAFLLDMNLIDFHVLAGHDTHLDKGPAGHGIQDPKSRKFDASYVTAYTFSFRGAGTHQSVLKDVETIST